PAPNRPRRAVERREEAVAGGVDLFAPRSHQLAPNEGMVALEQFSPPRVAYFHRCHGGANDVGEHHRGQHPVGLRCCAGRLPNVIKEALYLGDDRRDIGGWRYVAVDRELDERCAWYPPRQVSAAFGVDPPVA